MAHAGISMTGRAASRRTGSSSATAALILVLLLAPAPSLAAASAPLSLAVTLDDLPFVGALGPGDSRPAATARILEALRRHRVPATGFVVCQRIDDNPALLALWMKAGQELGNHSTTHAHLDAVALDDWTKDVCGCGERLAALTGARVRWFRYPFLQMGATIARRDSALAIVRHCGHEVAHISIDTGEWALVKPYVAALEAGDQDWVRAIGEAYVEHLLAAIEARGWRFVSLAEALADPVYRRPDDYSGPIGLSWLYRFAPAADHAWAWDDAQVRALQERFAR